MPATHSKEKSMLLRFVGIAAPYVIYIISLHASVSISDNYFPENIYSGSAGKAVILIFPILLVLCSLTIYRTGLIYRYKTAIFCTFFSSLIMFMLHTDKSSALLMLLISSQIAFLWIPYFIMFKMNSNRGAI